MTRQLALRCLLSSAIGFAATAALLARPAAAANGRCCGHTETCAGCVPVGERGFINLGDNPRSLHCTEGNPYDHCHGRRRECFSTTATLALFSDEDCTRLKGAIRGPIDFTLKQACDLSDDSPCS